MKEETKTSIWMSASLILLIALVIVSLIAVKPKTIELDDLSAGIEVKNGFLVINFDDIKLYEENESMDARSINRLAFWNESIHASTYYYGFIIRIIDGNVTIEVIEG